jgi:microcin C transport system permease protein
MDDLPSERARVAPPPDDRETGRAPAIAPGPRRFRLSPLTRRRLRNFRRNRRAFWSLWIFLALFVLSLFAELIANDKPLLLSYRGEILSPLLEDYPETRFGGDFATAADYTDPVVKCLIRTGGNLDGCLDEADGFIEEAALAPGAEGGWTVWPLIPFSYDTVDYDVATAPSPPDGVHWLGTDDQARDVTARIIYGFRLSVLFGFAVTLCSAIIGILAGAAQGFFGGWVDLTFQRVEEIWQSMNMLYVILIIASVLAPNIWVMFGIFVAFTWTQLIGVVRAEFLRARNFEYVQAARALGVADWTIMFRHLLPNAMVATLTMLPFMLTGSIGLLAGLDFLGFGLEQDYPSLGELALQGKKYLQDIHLALSAFFTFAIMLSLMVFVFEGVRDAFDPRKSL